MDAVGGASQIADRLVAAAGGQRGVPEVGERDLILGVELDGAAKGRVGLRPSALGGQRLAEVMPGRRRPPAPARWRAADARRRLSESSSTPARPASTQQLDVVGRRAQTLSRGLERGVELLGLEMSATALARVINR